MTTSGNDQIYIGMLGTLATGLAIAIFNIVVTRRDRTAEKARAEGEKIQLAEVAAAKADSETASSIKDIGTKIEAHVNAFGQHCADDLKFQATINQEMRVTNDHIIRLDERVGAISDGIKYIVGKVDHMAQTK